MEATPVSWLRWMPLLPLAGAAVNGLAGPLVQRRAGKGAIAALAVVPVALSFALALGGLVALLGRAPADRALIDVVGRWIAVGSLRVDLALWLDPLSCTMALVITGVGGLIHLYATAYMADDDAYWRFFAYLNLFTFAMLVLVLADNLLLLFVGWEGVGFCSWALIGFWWREPLNGAAGNKAFIVNRVGDAGFVLGIFALFWSLDAAGHGTLVFREIERQAASLDGRLLFGVPAVTVATLLLFVGATGKSAQFPLHVWLPDAMQGPTPVSALIHAATMVTAGVYLIARLGGLYALAPATLAVITGTGAVTAFGAATVALVQTDIKRVLAYSTVSQLGLMFVAMGVGAYGAGVFHLVTHAFFKGCLFLGAGSVIHGLHHEQDMRKMGGLRGVMPVTFWTFAVAALAISGAPLTAGFFSKDAILWAAWSSPLGSPALWLVGFAGAGLTSCYMVRQLLLVFFGRSRAAHDQGAAHESPLVMTLPLVLLAAGSVAAGGLGVPALMGGADRFDVWLAPVFAGARAATSAADGAGLEWALTAAAAGVAALGAVVAIALYGRTSRLPDAIAGAAGGGPYRLLLAAYHLDAVYWALFGRGVLGLARFGRWLDTSVIDAIVDGAAALTRGVARLEGSFDRVVVDGVVNALGNRTLAVGARLRRLQSGNINAYLYVAVGAVAVVLLARLF